MRSPATPTCQLLATARWRCLSAIREVYPTGMCWSDSLVSMGGMRSSFWSSRHEEIFIVVPWFILALVCGPSAMRGGVHASLAGAWGGPARFCGCRGRQARQVLADLSSSLGLSILPVCVLLGWAVGSAPGMYRNISSSLCSVPALSRYWGHPNLWCSTRLWVWRCVGTPQRRRLWRHTRVSSQGVGCLLRGGE